MALKDKPKMGRPSKVEGGTIPVSVRLPKKHVELLIKKHGKASIGIERAVGAYLKGKKNE